MSRRSAFDVPVATYRLQLHRGFTFDHARAILPYLSRLGISHLYCSPFLKARAGSTHGYDVVDYQAINPELGGEPGFARFSAALADYGLGLILDFVPNHMGVGKADNRWWLDVLEWGEASAYSAYFDIDWTPHRRDLEHKLLVPVLGKNYGESLIAGEIQLRFDAALGQFDFWYYEHRLPLSPRDYPTVLEPLKTRPLLEGPIARLEDVLLAGGDPRGLHAYAPALKRALVQAAREPAVKRAIDAAALRWQGHAGDIPSFVPEHQLLQRQAYRLAYWRTASDEINYRRFFDIDNLAGMRMERITVFRDTHELVGRLLAEGRLQGLRIDHVDGLADPQQYCRRLNAFAATIAPRNSDGRRLRPYVLVEKILADEERLPANWPVAGTTGYDYLAAVNGLFIDRAGLARLQRHWRRFTGHSMELAEEIHQCRNLVIDRYLSSELTYLVNWLVDIAEADWFTRDFTRKRLRDALIEIVSAFGVYRTYVTERGASEVDRREIGKAVEAARRRWAGTDVEILDFIRSILTLEIAKANTGHYARKTRAILRFIARFQQYTGAIAAKAVEDTLFYRYVPLASANEVGAAPERPAISIAEFHQKMSARAAAWSFAMSATATHDTKRGEDMRARLDVLSEMPEEWARRVARWHIYNRAHRTNLAGVPAPSRHDEYLLYQSIVGTWPMHPGALLRSDELRRDYLERLKTYALKCAREAKMTTSWTAPDPAYEQALGDFIDRIFAAPQENPFIQSVLRFLTSVRRLGVYNGLAQLVLKATSPGVPDFYQGTEFWDLSMVDPDNRRPVDFGARSHIADQLDLGAAIAHWRDGWLKLWLMRRLLALRNRRADLFRDGSYEPLRVEGAGEDRLVAYQRRRDGDALIVIVLRLLAGEIRVDRSEFWSGAAFLEGTRICGAPSGAWVDELSGARIESCARGVVAAKALSMLPVAVYTAA